MKARIKIYFLILFISIWYSCTEDNLLNKYDHSELSADNFFLIEQDALDAVAGVYDVLGWWGMYGEWSWELPSLLSDESYVGMSHPNVADMNADGHKIFEYRLDPTNLYFPQPWYNRFVAIMRSNFVQENIAKMDSNVLAADMQNRLMAEVRFIKALAYFDLVRYFGEIPLYNNIPPPSETKMGKAGTREIWQQIVVDLEFAVANLPQKYDDASIPGGSDYWRIHKGAANTLLAHVFITIASYNSYPEFFENINIESSTPGSSYWEKARNLAKEVIDWNQYSLQEDFANNFNELYENDGYNSSSSNWESVLEIQFWSNRIDGMDRWSDWGNNGNFMTHMAAPRAQVIEWGNDGCLPLNTFMDTWPDNDYRKKASVLMPGDTLDVSFDFSGAPDYFVNDLSVWDNGFSEYSVHFNKKYIYTGPAYTSWGSSSPLNVKAIRYAETLLIFAEAENEANGPNSAAYDAVNTVRRRAKLGDLSPGLSKDDFRKAIIDERKFELAFEGFRWFDLKRHGLLEQEVRKSRGDYTCEIQMPKHLLIPIPQNEIDLNPNLYPNNGY